MKAKIISLHVILSPMKTLLIAAVLVVSTLSQTTSAAEADGFRGLSWGTEFSTVANSMTLLGKDSSYGGAELYKRKTTN